MPDRPFVEPPYLISRSIWQIGENESDQEVVRHELIRPYADNRLMIQLIRMSWRVCGLHYRMKQPSYKPSESDRQLIHAIR